jgi:hypothetical protein
MGQSLSSLSLVHFRISLFGRLATISSSRPSFAVAPRAVTVKGRPQAVAKQLALDGHEHGGRLHWSGKSFPAVRATTTIPRGARHQRTQIAPQPCIRSIHEGSEP